MITVNELNIICTNTINEYLNQGYVVSMLNSHGIHSNEIWHVDLVNPKFKNDVVRVWMLAESTKVDEADWVYVHTLNLCVKKYTVKSNSKYDTVQTIWPDSGELISERKFYAIDDNKCYTDSLNEYLAVRQTRLERSHTTYSLKFPDTFKVIDISKLTKNFVDSIMNRVHATRGCKRVKPDCIKQVALNKVATSSLVAHVRWEYNTHSGCITLK